MRNSATRSRPILALLLGGLLLTAGCIAGSHAAAAFGMGGFGGRPMMGGGPRMAPRPGGGMPVGRPPGGGGWPSRHPPYGGGGGGYVGGGGGGGGGGSGGPVGRSN